MPHTIEEVVDAVAGWRGRSVQVEPLAGGLTNANYLVTVDGVRTVIRIPGAESELLAVDRANEAHNTRVAAMTGVGAEVLHELPQFGVLVLGYIDGVTMSNEALGAAGMPARIAAALRRLHAGDPFLHDFDMFRLVERYLAVVAERAIEIPAGYRAGLPAVARIEAALAVHRLPPVPCHNDLLAENYLDDGVDIRIIDYEYSGNNDPTFELGNTCQELGWDEARVRELCAAYFGGATAALIARMRLQMVMSDMGWTLWAAIQAKISPIDFDFRGWAEERWARAAAMIAGPDFEDWLRDVQG